jgi:hypothetical protein
MMLHHRRKAPSGGKTRTKATAHKAPKLGSRANPWGRENAGQPGAYLRHGTIGWYYVGTYED